VALRTKTVTPRPGARRTGLGPGLVVAAVIVAFWPPGLDQFLLPKQLVLLAGVPAACAAGGLRGVGRADRTFVVLALAAVLWAVAVPPVGAANPWLHAVGASQLLLLAGLGAAAAGGRAAAGEAAVRRTLAWIAAAGTAAAALAVLQGLDLDPLRPLLHVASSRPGRWRVLSTLGNPGWTAETVALAAPAVLAWTFRRRLGSVPGWAAGGALLGVLILAVAVTGSRAGALLLAAGIAATAALAGARGRTAAAVAAVALGATLLLAAAAGSWRWGAVRPLTGRAGLWAAGVALAAGRPVTGWGLAHTQVELPWGLARVVARTPPRLRPLLPTTLVDRLDDDWIQIAAEAGIPAAALALVAALRALLLAVRRARWSGEPSDAAVAAILGGAGLLSLVSSPLHTPATAAVVWAVAGLAVGADPPPEGGAGAGGGGRAVRRVAAVAAVAATLVAALGLAVDTVAGRGRWLYARGAVPAAAEAMALGVRWFPWCPGPWVLAARTAYEAGRPAEALLLAGAARRWVATEHLWAVEVRALRALGRPDLARRRLERALRLLPGSPVLRALGTGRAAAGGHRARPGSAAAVPRLAPAPSPRRRRSPPARSPGVAPSVASARSSPPPTPRSLPAPQVEPSGTS